ncbi:MAG: peptidylprolyl isomerase [Anaerolineae bacterium]
MTKRKAPQKRLTRRQLARHEREHRAQRLMTWIAIGVGVVITAILIYGVVTEVFIKARRPVARVGEETITTRQFKARQSYERWMTELEIYQYQTYLSQLSAQQQAATTTPEEEDQGSDDYTDALIQQLQLQLSSLEQQLSADMAPVYAGQVLDAMIEEIILRQEASKRDLNVSDEEIDQAIQLMLGYDPEATSALTETETLTDTVAAPPQEDFESYYEQFQTNVLEVARYPEEDFRETVRANIIRERIQTELAKEIPQVQDQVETTIFTVGTEEAAEALRARIEEEGVDPETIVEEFSDDEDEMTSGYALGWLPMGYLGPQMGIEVEQAAFNTPVGQASQPVVGQDGQYYVVYVSGHEERELGEQLLAQAEQEAYEGWLAKIKDERVEYYDWESAVVTE